MSKLSINFYSEKIEVDFPNNLSDLYQKIIDNFFFSETDVKELLITYSQGFDKMFIESEEDFKYFTEAKVYVIDIDINLLSELYKNSLLEVQKKNEDIIKEYDDIINKVNNIDKKKKEKKEKANNEIETINKKIKDLELKKKELIQKIDKEITTHQNQIKVIKENVQKEIESLEEQKKQLFKKVDNINVKLGLKPKINQNKEIENKKEIKKDEIYEKEEENNDDEYQCDGCEISPIEGKRFHCQICENFDLCEKCYSSNEKLKHFNGNHTFICFIKKSQKKNII